MPADRPAWPPPIQAFLDKGLFDRLPVSFSTFCFDQIKDWALLFPAEHAYFLRLFALFDRSAPAEVETLFAPMRAAEIKMGVNEKNWPKRQFTLDQVDFLNRNPHYAEWRAAVSNIFVQIDPVLDAEVARAGRPRLVIVISPSEIPADPDRMWLRIASHGKRIPIQPGPDIEDFVALMITGQKRAAHAPSLAELYAGAPYEAWTIEAGALLSGVGTQRPGVVRCGYAQLEAYRKRLMSEVNQLVSNPEIRGPRQLSARLKLMKVLASEGEVASDPLLAEFMRATLLSGNGTLLINNTFVEWATVQAVRRAKPSVTLVGFGVRNKVKPFSSLLIYADQDRSNPIPTQMDTLGTYVDLEVHYQYIWQEFQKYAEYRRNTVFLFAGEGLDQMLAIAPADFPLLNATQPVELPKIFEACKAWLGV